MTLDRGNPIVKVWREVESCGGTLQDARARVQSPHFASSLTETDIAGLDEALAEDWAEESTPALRFLACWAAQAAEHLPRAVRRRAILGLAAELQRAAGLEEGSPDTHLILSEVLLAALLLTSPSEEGELWTETALRCGLARAQLGDLPTARHILEDTVAVCRQLRAASGATHERRLATALENLGVVLADLRELGLAREQLGEAVAVWRDVASHDPTARPDLSRALNNLGTVARESGDRDGARALFEEALSLCLSDDAAQPDALEVELAATLHNLGTVASDTAHHTEARGAYEQAVEGLRRQAAKDPATCQPLLAQALNTLGAELDTLGDCPAARRCIEESLAIRRELAANHPGKFLHLVAQTLVNLGALLASSGARNAARDAYQEALAVNRELARREPRRFLPDVATALNNLGALLGDLGEYGPARDALEEALRLAMDRDPADPDASRPAMARTLSNLATVLRSIAEWRGGDRTKAAETGREAASVAARSVAIYGDLAKAEPLVYRPLLAAGLVNLAAVLADLREPALARRAGEEAVAIFSELAEAEPAAFRGRLAAALNNLGAIVAAVDDPQVDGDAERQLYEASIALSAPDTPEMASRLGNLAHLHWRQGDLGAAHARAREAVSAVEAFLLTNRDRGPWYSFKEEALLAYRLVLEDPTLQGSSEQLLRVVEGLRQAELLSGLPGPEDGGTPAAAVPPSQAPPVADEVARAATLAGVGGRGLLELCPAAARAVYLTIQCTPSGGLFIVLDGDGVRHFRVGDEFLDAVFGVVKLVSDGSHSRPAPPRDFARAGKAAWDALPAEVRGLLSSDRVPVYVSLDASMVNVPLELLSPTGDARDFVGLSRVFARTPGLLRYTQALEERDICPAGDLYAGVFGDPRHLRQPELPEAAEEAKWVSRHLQERLGIAGSQVCLCVEGEATVDAFVRSLTRHPAIVHFAGHGDHTAKEPSLCFSGLGRACPRDLPPGRFDSAPLVVLNTCLAGAVDAMGGHYRGFPDAFLSRGAAAVISAAFPVGRFRAVTFAVRLYGRLAAGACLREALLDARRAVASLRGAHPLDWALYTPWGNVDARLGLP